MDTDVWRFQDACFADRGAGVPFFAAENIVAAESGAPVSCFAVYFKESWYSYASTPEWSAIGIASGSYPGDPGEVVVAIGQAGQTWQVFPRSREETLGEIDPRARGFTRLRSIGGVVHACGMGRLVYRRRQDGTWENISAPWPAGEQGVIGFTDLAGWQNGDLCCVGWAGEIWTRRKDTWNNEHSPTNGNFNAVAIHPDGNAYAVGDAGVMVKGQAGAWEVVETGMDANLQDVCVHDGRVYACSDFNVFALTEDGLEALWEEGGESAATTCLRLVPAAAQGLICVGSDDVLVMQGDAWTRLA